LDTGFFPNVVYTHCHNSSRRKLFMAGAPLSSRLLKNCTGFGINDTNFLSKCTFTLTSVLSFFVSPFDFFFPIVRGF
jgi:hypothetical protein